LGKSQGVSVPTDIELPRHPDASSAALRRTGDDWALTFTGEEPFQGEEFTIMAASLVEAGVDPSLDRLVTGYVETRLLAAGYGIAPSEDASPDSGGAWVLRP
jgi:hypothetical protein